MKKLCNLPLGDKMLSVVSAFAMAALLVAMVMVFVGLAGSLGGEVVEMGSIASPASHTFLGAVVTNTNGVPLDVRPFSTVGIQVEGITTATVTFEGTIDGATWYGVYSTKLVDGSQAITLTADGLVAAPVAGLAMFRVRVSSWSSGTITAKAMAVNLPSWTGP